MSKLLGRERLEAKKYVVMCCSRPAACTYQRRVPAGQQPRVTRLAALQIMRGTRHQLEFLRLP